MANSSACVLSSANTSTTFSTGEPLSGAQRVLPPRLLGLCLFTPTLTHPEGREWRGQGSEAGVLSFLVWILLMIRSLDEWVMLYLTPVTKVVRDV